MKLSDCRLAAWAGLVAAPVALAAPAPAADVVINSAKIYTADKARSMAQALAIRNGKLVFVHDRMVGGKYRLPSAPQGRSDSKRAGPVSDVSVRGTGEQQSVVIGSIRLVVEVDDGMTVGQVVHEERDRPVAQVRAHAC